MSKSFSIESILRDNGTRRSPGKIATTGRISDEHWTLDVTRGPRSRESDKTTAEERGSWRIEDRGAAMEPEGGPVSGRNAAKILSNDTRSGREEFDGGLAARPLEILDTKIRRKTDGPQIPGGVEKLRWLEYTRYRPPKIPRRSVISRIDNGGRRRPSAHPRIPFSSGQIRFLEEKFQKNVYLTQEDLQEISSALSLPQNRVKIWFQNRRAKVRRESQNQDVV